MGKAGAGIMKRLSICGQLVIGFLILGAAFVFGLRTRLFFNHVLFPLGFWLVFDAADRMLTGRSYFRRLGLAEGLAMLALAGLFGVVLDYHMVVLMGILKFHAVKTPFTAFQMYVGWAFCLPAIYESYVVVENLLSRNGRKSAASGITLNPPSLGTLRLIGTFLIAIPIFSAMWRRDAPGYLLMLSFTGMFLLLEYVQWRRGRTPLLLCNLRGNWRPWAAMVLASLPYTFLWEGLNGMMGSWVYANIFWLEPRIWNVPLVAFFGYLFWYTLFLSLLNALSERDLRLWDYEGHRALRHTDGAETRRET